jgi:hypothetical protein
MSCYGWEKGTIVIPSSQWAKFRKDLLAAWNAHQDRVLAVAKRAHTAAKAAVKGKRGKGRVDAMLKAIARECGGTLDDHGYFDATRRSSGWGSYRERDDSAHEMWEAVTRLILKGYDGWRMPTTVTLQAPKKSDQPRVAVSKSCTISMPEAYAVFDNDRKTVTWDVPENNRSVERAKEHWFARKLFAALGRIEWTRNSGGTIRGNDEYNEDGDGYGRREAYVVATYRRLTAAEKRAKAERERRSRSRYW